MIIIITGFGITLFRSGSQFFMAPSVAPRNQIASVPDAVAQRFISAVGRFRMA